jgi:hypothetical protein
MKLYATLTVLLSSLLITPPAGAADLARIDRSINKEPAYKTKRPRYCLLVLGAEAERRVWLVLDGDVLYVDKNGNGDLTEPDKKLKVSTPNQDPASFEATEIVGPDGTSKHKLEVSVFGWLHKRGGDQGGLEPIVTVSWKDNYRFVAWGDEKSALAFTARLQDAPIVHIGGRLHMGMEIRNPLSRKSADEFELNVAVGCPGLGQGAFASLIYTPIPEGLRPHAILEFPGATPGAPPIKVEMDFKQRC